MLEGNALVFQVFHKASSGTFDKQDAKASSEHTNIVRTKKLNMKGQTHSIISRKTISGAFRSMLCTLYDAHSPLLPYIKGRTAAKNSDISSRIAAYTQAPEYQLMGGLTRNGLDVIYKHACLRFTDSISIYPYHYDTLFHTNAGFIRQGQKQGYKDLKNEIYTKEAHLSYYTFAAVLNTRFLPQDSKTMLTSMVFQILLNGIVYTRGGVMQSTTPLVFILALAKRDEPTFHNKCSLCKRDNKHILCLQDDLKTSDNFIYENDKILGLVLDTEQLRLDNAKDTFVYYGEEGYRHFIERYQL